MKTVKRSVGRLAVLVGVTAALSFASAGAAEFTYDEKVNEQMAKKLNIPVFFAVPASARAPLPKDINTTDKLIDFKHPDAKDAAGDVGLRLVVARRSGLSKRLADSGLVQTGDLLLSFRTEWGGAGAYPNIQMGISHTGVAYVKDGKVENIDNPLNHEYNAPGLSSEHYRTLDYIHVIRPRGLTDEQRANIVAWATRLHSRAGSVYPNQLAFNQDYNKPKYQSTKMGFVKHLGQIALGQNPEGTLDLYCSEFAFALLSLRNCDPEKTADDFKGRRTPSCIEEPMRPLRATGNVVPGHWRNSRAGLADGPLIVIDSLDLPKDKRLALLESVFKENPAGLSKMSVGHRQVAEEMQPQFERLKTYYVGITGPFYQSWPARWLGMFFNISGIPDNYSPTSYLINTLQPEKDKYRTMDYVATIVLQ